MMSVLSETRECDSDKQFCVKISPQPSSLISPFLTHFPSSTQKKIYANFTPIKYLIFGKFK